MEKPSPWSTTSLSYFPIGPLYWKKKYKRKFNWINGFSRISYLPSFSPNLSSTKYLVEPSKPNLSHSTNAPFKSIGLDHTNEQVSDLGNEDQDYEEQRNERVFRIPRTLLTSRNKYIAQVSERYVLVVTDYEQTFILHTDIRKYIGPGSIKKIGSPSAIFLTHFEDLQVYIGFTSGSFAIFSVQDLQGHKSKLELSHFAVLEHSRFGAIQNIFHRQNFIVVYTESANMLFFSINEGSTQTTSVLETYIGANEATSFSVRRHNDEQLLFCISVAYCSPNTSGTWSPYIQEIWCNPDGSIVNTRMSTASSSFHTNPQSSSFIHGTKPPSSISYSYPYLLVGFPDNTVSYYNVHSTDNILEIQPNRRLWGHTKGIKHVSVKSDGVAVSVSSGFPEIRLWDLGEVNHHNTSTFVYVPHKPGHSSDIFNKRLRLNYKDAQEKANISSRSQTASTKSNIGYEHLPNQQKTGGFFAFEKDMVIVEMLFKKESKEWSIHDDYEPMPWSYNEDTIDDCDCRKLMICDFS